MSRRPYRGDEFDALRADLRDLGSTRTEHKAADAIVLLAREVDELRFAIAGHDYDHALRHGNFLAMARVTEAARQGALARATAAEAERDALADKLARVEGALRELQVDIDIMAAPRVVPPEDVALAKQFGGRQLGRMMVALSQAWREDLASAGYPVGGEFIAGPCRGTAERMQRICRAALDGGDSA